MISFPLFAIGQEWDEEKALSRLDEVIAQKSVFQEQKELEFYVDSMKKELDMSLSINVLNLLK